MRPGSTPNTASERALPLCQAEDWCWGADCPGELTDEQQNSPKTKRKQLQTGMDDESKQGAELGTRVTTLDVQVAVSYTFPTKCFIIKCYGQGTLYTLLLPYPPGTFHNGKLNGYVFFSFLFFFWLHRTKFYSWVTSARVSRKFCMCLDNETSRTGQGGGEAEVAAWHLPG